MQAQYLCTQLDINFHVENINMITNWSCCLRDFIRMRLIQYINENYQKTSYRFFLHLSGESRTADVANPYIVISA